MDADGIYTYASPQVHDLLGYESEEVLGQKPFDFMPTDESAHIREEFFARIRDRKALVDEITDTPKPAAERVLDLINRSIQDMRSLNAELAPPVLNSGDLSSSLEWTISEKPS